MNSIKKISAVVFFLFAFMLNYSVSAELLKIKKITDFYALRENSELVRYRETVDNKIERIAVEVVDFNDFAYITESGNLYTIEGEHLSENAEKMPALAPFAPDGYNGNYAFISKDNRLIFPASGTLPQLAVSDNIKDVKGNLLLKTNGDLCALVLENGAFSEKTILDNVTGIYGEDGEYLALDSLKNCYFIPLKNGQLIYGYDKLLLEQNVRMCENLDSIITNSFEWYKYSINDLKKGKVLKTLKSQKALDASGGDYLYYLTDGSAACYYKGEENWLFGNVREIRQIKKGSMDGYIMDNSDTIHRLTGEGNVLTCEEILSPTALFAIRKLGDGYCIAITDSGELYGIDGAVGFGTGAILKDAAVDCIALPLSRKNIDVYIDGKKVNLSRRIIEQAGRTVVPFREVAEMLGATVEWDNKTQTGIAKLGDKSVKFTIKQAAYLANGEKAYMDVAPMIDELTNSIYVPIRYMAEALGYNVEWKTGVYDNIITVGKVND